MIHHLIRFIIAASFIVACVIAAIDITSCPSTGTTKERGQPYEASPRDNRQLPDGQAANRALQLLGELKDKPFFLAVGFSQPHLLLQSVEQGKTVAPRALFWRARRGRRTWHAVREGSLKYVARREGDKWEEFLFDLKSDQAEQHNLLAARPADAQRLKQGLAQWEKLCNTRAEGSACAA